MSDNKGSSSGCGCTPIFGWGIGTFVAAILSWGVNHSILWALIHGFLGWIYIVYYVITY